MTCEFTIPGCLPTLNEHLGATNRNRFAGNKLKQDADDIVIWEVKRQLAGIKIIDPVHISIVWVCKDKRKDLDNICSAKKFLCDGMVRAGLLQGDGWKHITGFTDTFKVDKGNPRIIVTIQILEGE